METIGLIAGEGRFPILFAEEARRMGHQVVVFGFKGVTDPELERHAHSVHYIKLGQLNHPIELLKKEGVSRVIMAGKVQHRSIYDIQPDWRTVKVLARLKDRRTDTVLKAVAEELAKDGIELISSATYLSHLLAPEGVLTQKKPASAQEADIELGWKAAKALSGLDIGQTVVLSEGAVVALEGMEGTDACILRARDLVPRDVPLTVVKVAKPGQDFRFDLPVLGLDTIEILKKARVQVLAVEAGKTLLLDRTRLLKELDQNGICLIARKS